MGIFQPAIAMSPEVVANLKMGQTFAPKKERKYIVSQATKMFQIRNGVRFRVRVLPSFPIPKLCSPLTTSAKNGRRRSWIWASDSSCSAWRQHRIWGNKQTQQNKTNQNKKQNHTINSSSLKNSFTEFFELPFQKMLLFFMTQTFYATKPPGVFFLAFEVVQHERRDVAVT